MSQVNALSSTVVNIEVPVEGMPWIELVGKLKGWPTDSIVKVIPVSQEDLVFEEYGLTINPRERFVVGPSGIWTPPNKEFGILSYLSGQPDTVFDRDTILERVWGPEHYGKHHKLDVHVSTLRNGLLRNVGVSKRVIETVRAVGFIFKSSLVASKTNGVTTDESYNLR